MMMFVDMVQGVFQIMIVDEILHSISRYLLSKVAFPIILCSCDEDEEIVIFSAVPYQK